MGYAGVANPPAIGFGPLGVPLPERLPYLMPRKPSDDATRIERIGALCADVSKTIQASRHQRASRETLKLAESAGVKRRAKTKPKS